MKYLNTFTRIILIGLIAFAFSCDIEDGNNPDPEVSPNPSAIASPVPPPKQNPLCTAKYLNFGKDNNNLWKPVSDTQGNIGTFIIDNDFTVQFNKCFIELKTGKLNPLRCIDNQPWTNPPFSCFSNGDRQHWRNNVSSQKVKNSAKIICEDNIQQCTFRLNGSALKRQE